ncbi:hypothetical protein ACOMHN_026370 [Nucella lapillus]
MENDRWRVQSLLFTACDGNPGLAVTGVWTVDWLGLAVTGVWTGCDGCVDCDGCVYCGLAVTGVWTGCDGCVECDSVWTVDWL